MMKKTKALTERGHEIVRVAASGDVGLLAVLLQSGVHHGKAGASQAEKLLAAETLLDTYRKDPAKANQLVRDLATSPAASARQVACAMLQELWLASDAWTPLVMELAADDDWEVREWSAPLFTLRMATDFPKCVPDFEQWVRQASDPVKRQIALAIKQTAQKRIPDSANALLALIEPLLSCEDEYIRKNLGPFAIGDGLLRVYPAETLAAMRQWVQQDGWAVRWNVAMSFSGAEGARQADAAFELLSVLHSDPRKQVQSAVQKVCKNIIKRRPDEQRFTPWLTAK